MLFLMGLFVIGVLGFVLNNRQLIFILLALELMIFVVAFRLVYFGFIFDDLVASHFSLYLLVLAGAESAVALSLLVAFHRVRGSIQIF
uniref:NADH-ubiquinone oxidoreductase chain 4L n=1 Tax=Harpochytrium sp. JEL105 TaxID=224131 RepID=Q85MD4_9FUNG|nr:NADH dehydrogenase subunit 4L [Harpochytrium sp. JEL105]AAO64948.1 NADH dehydrogenase subunit 4L [Harpochytrium sp. JEL105]